MTLTTHIDQLQVQSFDWGTLQWLCNGTLLPGATQTVGICHLWAGQAQSAATIIPTAKKSCTCSRPWNPPARSGMGAGPTWSRRAHPGRHEASTRQRGAGHADHPDRLLVRRSANRLCGVIAMKPPLSLDPLFRPASVAVVGASVHARQRRQHPHAQPARQPVRRRRLPGQPETQGGPRRPLLLRPEGRARRRSISPSSPRPPPPCPTDPASASSAGSRPAIIISAGFSELGAEGRELERQIRDIARGKMRIVGPNCLGVIHPPSNLNASFAAGMARPGTRRPAEPVGGHLHVDPRLGAARRTSASRSFVSVGAMLDVDFADLIDYFGDDPATRSIVLYMESVGDVRKFLSAPPGPWPDQARHRRQVGPARGGGEGGGVAHRRPGRVRRRLRRRLPPRRRLARDHDPRSVQHGRDPGHAAAAARAGPGDHHQRRRPRRHGDRRADARRRPARASSAPTTLAALDKVLPPFWSHANPIDVLGDATPGALPAGRRDLREGPERAGLARAADAAGDDRPDARRPASSRRSRKSRASRCWRRGWAAPACARAASILGAGRHPDVRLAGGGHPRVPAHGAVSPQPGAALRAARGDAGGLAARTRRACGRSSPRLREGRPDAADRVRGEGVAGGLRHPGGADRARAASADEAVAGGQPDRLSRWC